MFDKYIAPDSCTVLIEFMIPWRQIDLPLWGFGFVVSLYK